MKQFFVVVSLFGIMSCSKGGDDPDPGGEPNPNPGPGGNNTELTITTVTPNSGEILPTPVTINGTGFNTTATNNTVHISGIPATVTSATATALQVTLPANLNAGDHDIRVAANGKSATKTNAFHLVGWIVSNFVGSGNNEHTDGTGDAASFKLPGGLVSDAAGNFYVTDLNKIRKITAQGIVSTFAGGNGGGSINGNGENARFRLPTALAMDAGGNVYVADNFNHQIRKISPDGDVTTIAGKAEEIGNADGIGEAARFTFPYGIAVDPTSSFLYVGDHGNDVIRKISLATREVTTIAGNGTRTRRDATGLQAGIPGPGNLAFDADGNLIITEKGAGMIRKMTPDGKVTTIGNAADPQDVQIQPTHLAFDKDKHIYVVFSNARSIRKYAPDASWINFAGAWSGPNEENGPASVIQFQRPEGIVLKEDVQGNKVFYVVDSQRKKIKKISKQ